MSAAELIRLLTQGAVLLAEYLGQRLLHLFRSGPGLPRIVRFHHHVATALSAAGPSVLTILTDSFPSHAACSAVRSA